MQVLSPSVNNGPAYPGQMGYGAPMPQPGVHHGPPMNGGGYPQVHHPPGGGYYPPPQGPPMMTPVPMAAAMTYHDQAERARKMRDYEALTQIITQWNSNRLDLFALSLPNENLEFNGVMRFYYQSQDGSSGQKVATKCIRVTSTATTKDIIETLIEKFRPDMKMLEVPEYALYEIHESGERKLDQDEKPLLVQLNWHKDDREGRFLLRRIDEISQISAMMSTAAAAGDAGSSQPAKDAGNGDFKRKLSKREKKELKKQEKLNKANNSNAGKGSSGSGKDGGESSVAEKLYTELPDTSFTRSISNPEAVMRRRRQQKLEKKLIQFRSKDGGPDTGGTLKIYGEALCKEVPYKTLLLSVRDTAAYVVEEMLEKYGLDRKEAHNYCLVQVINLMASTPNGSAGGDHGQQMASVPREYYLEDDECPLAILMNHQQSRGTVMFHIRRKPADFYMRKRKKKPIGSNFMSESALLAKERLPFLLEMNPDGSDIVPGQARMPQRIFLSPNMTEVGSDPAIQASGQCLLLPPAPFVHSRHCVIAHTEGIVTVTPSHREAETYVNNARIFQTTILQPGSVVRFGRAQCFRFIDPMAGAAAERLRHTESSVTLPPDNYSNYAHYGPPGGMAQPPSRMGAPIPGAMQQHLGQDHILPAVLEFREETEETFFNEIITGLDINNVQFKLAPTYTLYMATRFRASTHYRTELIPEERAVRLTDMLNFVAEQIYSIIEASQGNPNYLAFWMANASEFLHFLKSDRHITSFSHQAQDLLAEAVHLSFKHLVICLQSELEMALPALLFDTDDDLHGGAGGGEQPSVTTQGILTVLQSAMGLLRKCRVNAALTIQLFSQLFHFINMWAFNSIVGVMPSPHQVPGEKFINYCTHKWGLRLKRRLSRIENWAEKQGLELAADCHLARIVQAAHLLMARKNTAEDIASVSSICYKLNSLQLKTLLNKYESSPDEKPISKEMVDTIVRVAENTIDQGTNAEGREVRLEEDYVLQLPFLLPEDGYSCDVVRGVPSGLLEFLAPLQRGGLCIMTPQPTSSGFWTIYMDHFLPPSATPVPRSPSEMGGPMPPPQAAMMNRSMLMSSGSTGGEPEVQTIRLVKSNSGMGLSIVAAKGVGKDRLGIYIKAVVEGGAAWHDGRLMAGDQLLKVDGQSLVGITQERAAEIMMQTGQIVELEVAKQGAIFHGLATLLSQLSPVMSRANSAVPLPPLPSGASSSSGSRAQQPMADPRKFSAPAAMMQPSRSVQSLHDQQHTYQNHMPNAYYDGQPQKQQMSPMHAQHMRHPSVPASAMMQPQASAANAAMARSTSIQNMPMSSGPSANRVPNGFPSHRVSVGDDQGFYQNIGPNSQAQHLQQPMPLRYQGPSTPRYDGGPMPQASPMGPIGYLDGHTGRFEDLHHASPRIVGTPLSSGSMGSAPRLPHQQLQQTPLSHHSVTMSPSAMSPIGPEKPVRQPGYPYDNNGQSTAGNNSGARVRFQDNMESSTGAPNKVPSAKTSVSDAVSSQLEQLRLSSVEREFRRRVAEYNRQNGEDSEEDERHRHHGGGVSRVEQERLKKLEAMERKQRELEDAKRDEDRILREAAFRRGRTDSTETPPPPPLPAVPPPDASPAGAIPGAQRLDMLLGTGNGSKKSTSTPTKKVSFMTDAEAAMNNSVDNEDHDLEQDVDTTGLSDGAHNEKLNRLERVERDPNAFIKEAENLLNSSSMSFDKFLDFKATGHTPSVIGTQEVYRDPRMKRMQKAEEEKATNSSKRDGAKLSFKEKMLLFAKEAGERSPQDKAKISRAQRNIDGEGSMGGGGSSGSGGSINGDSPTNS